MSTDDTKRIKSELRRVRALLRRKQRGDDFIALTLIEHTLGWALDKQRLPPTGMFTAMQQMRAEAEKKWATQ